MARHYSSWSRNMNLYYQQMAPRGVCFWFCIACHEIWATQNVSPYIVPAYELCSFYAADWVLDQWFTVSLYTAALGGRRAEHIWGSRFRRGFPVSTQIPNSGSQSRSRILGLNPDHEFWVSIGPILNHCIPLHLLHHTITISNWPFALYKSSSHLLGSGFHVGNLCRMRISNLVTSCEDHWSP